ncbi:cell surface receptor/MFS transporter [Patellaria atrata CBS 101060]|uniref:Cell surface receptor/MFS transporter n=1 Tax=Patellaria atrata CBS 101060 TaxID=1346257 RepID=A0A9P4SG70_9PEZI|nr:cell surface receptor/MFS transporter [Patellaria atrata CBS 101060]
MHSPHPAEERERLLLQPQDSPPPSPSMNPKDHSLQRLQSLTAPYRVYKQRWFGLLQLVLLNIVVSWDWLTFSAVSKTTSEYFEVSETAVNWLSTAFMFAFVTVSPLVIKFLHLGPKPAIVASSVLLFTGNWVRYIGARSPMSRKFKVVMFGQILTGLAQPFVLAAPTRFSDLWFSEKGRISATAVASLANPFGGALAQLIGPMWATEPSDIPNLVLWVSLISTVACLPSFFLSPHPPTPSSSSSSLPKTPITQSLRILLHTPTFYFILLPFATYVASFNAFSSLLNQILYPYAYTESDAGITGALLIAVGLVAAAISSPILDRTKAYLLAIKLLVPIIAASYLAFIWAPATRSLATPFTIAAILGAASFSLMPVALEYLVEATWPASPEVGSTICWTGGQLFGGLFIVIMNALKGAEGEPEGSMKRALVFQAVVCIAVVPAPLVIGLWRFKVGRRRGRWEYEHGRESGA